MPNVDITPEFLTTVLRRSGVLSQTSVTAVTEMQIGKDLGFNGILLRLALTYDADEPAAPKTLIAKFPQDESVADKSESESRFYREFGNRVGIRIPRAYLAEPEVLLLEDLASLKPGDVAEGCCAGEALLIVKHLAKLHASGWENPEFCSSDWLPRWPINPRRTYARLREFHSPFLKRFHSELPPPMVELTLKLVDRLPKVVDSLSQAPDTLIHVDTHLDNIFVEPPETVVLIDWPSAAIGPAAIDLGRFLSTSITTTVRREINARAATNYLTTLQQQGVDNYLLTDLEQHLKLATLRLWAGMVTGYGASNPAELIPRQRELQKIELARMTHVAEDWKLLQLIEEI